MMVEMQFEVKEVKEIKTDKRDGVSIVYRARADSLEYALDGIRFNIKADNPFPFTKGDKITLRVD